jgi:16S rRNA (guanine(966)-N(2))-methyltransferase RsmD
MSHRVIAGTARGRRLKLVPGDSTRPIMDRVKEALFSIIGRDIIDASLLDLFAGTGAVGIEALSRGAAHVTFFDLERRAIDTIRDNLKTTGLGDNADVRRVDSLAALRKAPARTFDYIYIAPPQYKGMWLTALEALDANPAWIPDGTQVILQIDPSEVAPVSLKRLTETDQRTYGKTLLWFFEAETPDDEPQADASESSDQG